ncbi:hybrid sensor histidine kinase/response regulator, partial [Pseudomonas sp. HMWF007]
EDNAFNRQVADELLTSEGAHVTLAEGGLEGVKKVVDERVSFDIVLMDIQMPDIDGLEATRRIRSHEEFLELPIVAMTANASISDREACMAAGMNEHVGKPIDLEHLVATLLFQVSGRVKPILQSPNKIGEVRDVVENKNTIINRFGGNLDLIQKVLSSFGPELEKQLVRLRHDILRHDTPNAALVLHTIKGSSGSMGATSLSAYAGSLEQQIKHGDEIAKASLLSDITWISELEVLLTKSIQQMNLDFGFAYPSSTTSNIERIELMQWKGCLEEILILLQAGNLDALDLVADLAPKTPDLLRERFNDFCLKVESLDFRAAIPMGQDLLESF